MGQGPGARDSRLSTWWQREALPPPEGVTGLLFQGGGDALTRAASRQGLRIAVWLGWKPEPGEVPGRSQSGQERRAQPSGARPRHKLDRRKDPKAS